MTELNIAGRIFKVDVTGEPTRPPLMLCNALGTDLSMWDGQMPVFARHFRVIRYDARGHGGSVSPGGSTSIADLGADALAILDALEIEKTDWLGLSMGGAIGLWLLVNAPSRIGRAVLASTAPKIGAPESWNTRIAAILSGGLAANAEATIERWFSPGFAEREPARVEPIRSALRSVSPEAYAACCAALRDMDLREEIRRIDHDVMILSGRDDPTVPAADAEAMAASINGAKHLVLKARHMSNIEAEADFTSAVVTFLTSKAPARARSRQKAPSKAASSTRGGAGRRSNAARRPLKKSPVKTATRKAAASSTRKAKKFATRRTAAKTSATRRGLAKVAVKTPAKAKRRKAAPTRRPTPVAAARAPVKKLKSKTTVTKAAPKRAAKKPTKKIPVVRRRATTKSRRPSGRRTR